MSNVNLISNRVYQVSAFYTTMVENPTPEIDARELVNLVSWDRNKGKAKEQQKALALAIYGALVSWKESQTGNSFPITIPSQKRRIALMQGISLAAASAARTHHDKGQIDFEFLNEWLKTCLHLATMRYFEVANGYDVKMDNGVFTVCDLALPFVLLHGRAYQQDTILQEHLGSLGGRLKMGYQLPTQSEYLELRNEVFFGKTSKVRVEVVEKDPSKSLPMGDEEGTLSCEDEVLLELETEAALADFLLDSGEDILDMDEVDFSEEELLELIEA